MVMTRDWWFLRRRLVDNCHQTFQAARKGRPYISDGAFTQKISHQGRPYIFSLNIDFSLKCCYSSIGEVKKGPVLLFYYLRIPS